MQFFERVLQGTEQYSSTEHPWVVVLKCSSCSVQGVSGPQINVMFALGCLPGWGHCWAADRAACNQFAQKCSIMGRGLARTRVGGAVVQDTRRCGGSGDCSSAYLSRIFILHKPAIFYVYQPNSSKYQCKLCNNVVIRRLLH